MHILLGALIIIGTFLLSLDYMDDEFSGFLNTYSLILLLGVPFGLTILTYNFATLASGLRGLTRAFLHNPAHDRDRLAKNLLAFGREIRRDRAAAASTILEADPDPVFRHIGRLVLQNVDATEIDVDAMILGRRDLEPMRTGERILNSLGDFAPAMGMLGTVIGLIQLLANMNDFEKLGPGMAIALLTTFYGLILAHLIFLPLARIIAERANQRAENLGLIVEGMLKITRRRPIHEVENILAKTNTNQPPATDGYSTSRPS